MCTFSMPGCIPPALLLPSWLYLYSSHSKLHYIARFPFVHWEVTVKPLLASSISLDTLREKRALLGVCCSVLPQSSTLSLSLFCCTLNLLGFVLLLGLCFLDLSPCFLAFTRERPLTILKEGNHEKSI